MSLKAELETWSNALKVYDADDFERALVIFSQMPPSSKILTNIGLVFATIGEHERAVEKFIEATNYDGYLAVAYFQCGVSNFLLGRYDLAVADFDEAWLRLRGNQEIRYQQLGLNFILYSAEILFNKGLCHIYLGDVNKGMRGLRAASEVGVTDEHDVIDEAIQNGGEGYTVFSIPIGILYRPAEAKVKSTKPRDFMGKAKLIASATEAADDPYKISSGVSNKTYDSLDAGIAVLAKKNAPAAQPDRLPMPPVPPEKPAYRPNTFITPSKPSVNAKLGGPGLYRAPSINTLPQSVLPDRPGRLTEFYDEFIPNNDGDNQERIPPVPTRTPVSPDSKIDRIAAWAQRSMKESSYPPGIMLPPRGTRSAPSTVYAPSSYGSVRSVRRRTTTRSKTSSRSRAMSYEDEEGYGSGGELDDLGQLEFHKIRVKLHYQDDLRGMTFAPEVSFKEFVRMVFTKFGCPSNGLGLKFRDEDGGMVSLKDESDYELAIETARENAKGKPEGKLEIWCTEL